MGDSAGIFCSSYSLLPRPSSPSFLPPSVAPFPVSLLPCSLLLPPGRPSTSFSSSAALFCSLSHFVFFPRPRPCPPRSSVSFLLINLCMQVTHWWSFDCRVATLPSSQSSSPVAVWWQAQLE